MLCRLTLLLLSTQSLADLAREEAERRNAIDQQGIRTRIVTTVEATREPVDAEGEPALHPPPRSRTVPRDEAPTHRRSLNAIKRLLRRLDQSIRKSERELALCRTRLQEGRWELPKVGKASKTGSRQGDAQQRAQERLRQRIEEIETELRRLREERRDAYEEGRRAGFHPGELDGKGVVP